MVIMTSQVNETKTNLTQVSSLPQGLGSLHQTQGTKSPKVDPRTARLFAQGIALIPKPQPKKNSSELLKKSEKYLSKAESLSKEIESIEIFVTDLKNPEIPDYHFKNVFFRIAPGDLISTIENSLMTAYPNISLETLRSNLRLLLQLKNLHGKNPLDHYLDQKRQKLQEFRELATLFNNLGSNQVSPFDEEGVLNRIAQLTAKRTPSSQFRLSYTLPDGIKEKDTLAISLTVSKLQQLQDLYFFLNTPNYPKEFILKKYQELDAEIKTALGKAIWVACYRPDELFFSDHFLAANPHVLLECKNESGGDVIAQLITHYKAQILLQRSKPALTEFAEKIKTTTDKSEQLKSFQALPEFAREDLAELVWLEHGGRQDPKFAYWRYGELKIEKNPLVLTQLFHSPSLKKSTSILEIYMGIIDQKINFDIQKGVNQFASEMLVPTNPIACPATQLKTGPKERIPEHTRVAMVTAEFAGVINMGGLAPAVSGIARAYGTDDVCVILPKYDVINPKLVLEEKKNYKIELNGEIHKVFKTKVNGITCYLIEDPLFKVGFNKENKPNNIYEGKDLEVKRRWTHFQSLSADLAYQLSQKKKNPVQLVQVHDAQTALVPKILQTRHYEEWKEGKTPATVFTFHNNNSPLDFDYPQAQDLLKEIGLPSHPINSFIEGLECSDMNSTVSETFAKEVQTDLFGKGMQRNVKINAAKGKLVGIVNGNTDGWNPKTDAQLKNWISPDGTPIDLSYGPDDENLPEKVKLIRQQLVEYLKAHNLGNFDPAKPIFFYVGRYDAYQKGIDKLPLIMEEVVKNGGQFICIGLDPDAKADGYLTKMEEFAKAHNHKGICIIRDFKRPDGRLYWQHGNSSLQDTSGVPGFGSLLRAAVDVGVFPSIFEPCGLVQGEMHRMGIETLATGTGGFADTIYTSGENRNGYLFARLPVWESEEQDRAILKSVHDALQRNQDKLDALYDNDSERLTPYIEQKRTIMRNAAKSTWTSSFDDSLSPANRYQLVYAKAFENQKQRGLIALDIHALGSASTSLQNLTSTSQQKLTFNPELYKTLGAHYDKLSGNTTFRVYAPHARAITIKLTNPQGNIEKWVEMKKGENGIWEAHSQEAKPDFLYHFKITSENGDILRKIDPFAFANHVHADSGEHESKIALLDNDFKWTDDDWMHKRVQTNPAKTPMSIYEVHVPTWKKQENGDPLNWKELAHELSKYCKEMGYSHVELMALFEHPHPMSMGYQITSFFALNRTMGSLEDFQYFVNYLHEQKIGVIIDWVPAHFATDAFSLGTFDGSPVLEDDEERFRGHPQWGTYEFDFKKQFTRDFLGSNLEFLLNQFHIDGVRVDAVQSMLELNYGRAPGTRKNAKGGSVNLHSKSFLRNINTYVHEKYPGVITIAEEAMGFPNLTRPRSERGIHTKTRGIGFDLTWHMGFMNNTLEYLATPPHHRNSSYSMFTGTVKNVDYNEDSRPRGKVVLPFSHDENANGKGTIFTKLGGDTFPDKFANGRLLLAYQLLRGGGPVLDFMGNEILQSQEWHGRLIKGLDNEQERKKASVQWEELDPNVDPFNHQYHLGARESRKALLHLYRDNPGLQDQTDAGFSWINAQDSQNGVLSFHRRGGGQQFACVFNSSNKDLKDYLIPLPNASYAPELDRLISVKEVYNTDDDAFGGGGRKNANVEIIRDNTTNRPTHLKLRLPPFSALLLEEGFARGD
jgi:1,4-alpha-glucan branching enzyme